MCIQFVKETKLPEELRKTLDSHLKSVAQPEDSLMHIQVCTCWPTHNDPGIIKVQLRTSNDLHSILSHIVRAFVILSGHAEFGSAPRHHLQRLAQDIVDHLRSH